MGRPKTIEDDELLVHALRVFRKLGYMATTRDVARAAGISQAVLYQRFKTKDDLFFAALTRNSPNLAALSDIDADAHEPRAYLEIFAAKTKDHYRSVLPSILTLTAHPKFGYGEKMMEQVHQLNRAGEISAIVQIRLLKWQQEGKIGPGNIMHFAHTFLHVMHTRAFIEVLSGKPQTPTQPGELNWIIDVLWNGAKPDGTAPKPKAAAKTKRA